MAKESDLLLLSERLVQLRRDATLRDMDLSSKIEALEELLGHHLQIQFVQRCNFQTCEN